MYQLTELGEGVHVEVGLWLCMCDSGASFLLCSLYAQATRTDVMNALNPSYHPTAPFLTFKVIGIWSSNTSYRPLLTLEIWKCKVSYGSMTLQLIIRCFSSRYGPSIAVQYISVSPLPGHSPHAKLVKTSYWASSLRPSASLWTEHQWALKPCFYIYR
jgi:hypothetical protein